MPTTGKYVVELRAHHRHGPAGERRRPGVAQSTGFTLDNVRRWLLRMLRTDARFHWRDRSSRHVANGIWPCGIGGEPIGRLLFPVTMAVRPRFLGRMCGDQPLFGLNSLLHHDGIWFAGLVWRRAQQPACRPSTCRRVKRLRSPPEGLEPLFRRDRPARAVAWSAGRWLLRLSLCFRAGASRLAATASMTARTWCWNAWRLTAVSRRDVLAWTGVSQKRVSPVPENAVSR